MKYLTLGLCACAVLTAASTPVDIYSAKDLQAMKDKWVAGHKPSAFETLKQYGNHYTMLAYREITGSSELHEHEADIFIITSGEGAIITGGKLTGAHPEKPGELRGKSVEGGERHAFGPGDTFHIPAGVAHQMLVEKGKPVTYFVVKVAGQ